MSSSYTCYTLSVYLFVCLFVHICCFKLQNQTINIFCADITWVCGDLGQVSLDVYNPMPFELKVSKMVRAGYWFYTQILLQQPLFFFFVFCINYCFYLGSYLPDLNLNLNIITSESSRGHHANSETLK